MGKIGSKMMGIATNCQKMTNFGSPSELFSALKERVRFYKQEGVEDLIPHEALSHGFMEWTILLGGQFPCLMWSGTETEKIENVTFEGFQRFLYNRFFIRLIDEGVFLGFTETEINKLKEKGFQEYLKD